MNARTIDMMGRRYGNAVAIRAGVSRSRPSMPTWRL